MILELFRRFGSLRFSFLYISKELFISLNYSKYIYKYLLSFRRDSLLFVTVTLFTYYFAVLRFNYFQRDNHAYIDLVLTASNLYSIYLSSYSSI